MVLKNVVSTGGNSTPYLLLEGQVGPESLAVEFTSDPESTFDSYTLADVAIFHKSKTTEKLHRTVQSNCVTAVSKKRAHFHLPASRDS